MRFFLYWFIFFAAIFSVIVLPLLAHAQAGLTVCGVTGGDLYSSFSCQFCSLFQLADKLIHYLILIAPVLAAVLFSYAGFLYMTAGGSVHGTEKAREIFTDVVVGMIIILCSFLVVDTLLRSIASGKLATPSWAAFQCTDSATRLKTINGPGGLANGQATPPLGAVNPQGGTGPSAVPAPGQTQPGAVTDAEARAFLQEAGISVNKANCTSGGTNCTSLDNIQQDTITQIANLKQACGCDLIFTGGTEGGHSAGTNSHSSGYKADVSVSPALDAYIQNNLTNMGFRGDNGPGTVPQYRDQYGNIYAREGDHWDILVNKGTGTLPPKSKTS